MKRTFTSQREFEDWCVENVYDGTNPTAKYEITGFWYLGAGCKVTYVERTA